MARKSRDEGGGYSWMDTYGDMVTLLLCFFVLLFAMSSVNEEKWEALVRAFSANGNESQQLILTPIGEGNDIAQNQGVADTDDERVNIETLPENFEDLFKYIKTYVEQNNMQGTVSVEKSGDNSVYIRFQDNIFFQPDSEALMPGSTGILDFIGNCIKAVEDQVLMTRVNGHTAAIPGFDDYKVSDRTLSSDRANAVISIFEGKIGIDGKKLMSQGYGKYFPVADNNTAEGRQKNRRVEMMIISNEVLSGSSEELSKVTQDMLSADLFNDQMNTQGMLMPPSDGTAASAASGAQAPAATTPTAPTEPTAPATAEPSPAPAPAPAGDGQEIPLP